MMRGIFLPLALLLHGASAFVAPSPAAHRLGLTHGLSLGSAAAGRPGSLAFPPFRPSSARSCAPLRRIRDGCAVPSVAAGMAMGGGEKGEKEEHICAVLFGKDATAGMNVAFTAIPVSIAFASIAGVSPLVGIWSSVVLGLISSVFGGRPGLISGSAGVVVVALAPLVAAHGASYVAPCMLLVALVEILFAFFKLGRYVDLVSDSVLKGFLNGLGCLLIKSQVSLFTALSGTAFQHALFVAVLTAATIIFLPEVTEDAPAPLVGVTAAALATKFFSLNVQTLAGVAGASTFRGGLSVFPSLALPLAVPLTSATFKIIAPIAFSIAMISMLETLLAGKMIEGYALSAGEIPPRSDNDRMLMGLSMGTAASAAVGGFGGCGLIPLTLQNQQSGGRGKRSSVSYAVWMALSVILAAPLIGSIPVASVAGVVLVTALSTLQPGPTIESITNGLSGKGGLAGVFNMTALIATGLICYFYSMASGIGAGVLISLVGNKVSGQPWLLESA